jgi:DNA-binding transcriptional regulator YiaG
MLTSHHTEQLIRLGITLETLKVAGVRSVTDGEGRETLGHNGHQGDDIGGILFPYLPPTDGARNGGRIRLDHPLPDGSKYVMEQGCRHLFFPPNVAPYLQDTNIPVVIVEAEKSALALCCFADRVSRLMLPIAVGGCWGWLRKIGKRALPNGDDEPETGPSPDLDWIVWAARLVTPLRTRTGRKQSSFVSIHERISLLDFTRHYEEARFVSPISRSEIRRRAGLTQIQLARLVGSSAAQICVWERGERDLQADTVAQIAVVLYEQLQNLPVFECVEELARALATSAFENEPVR